MPVIAQKPRKKHRKSNDGLSSIAPPARDSAPTQHPRFTILIGSRARRTEDQSSDLDIVRIGHTNPATKIGKQRVEPTYIDYDVSAFWRLFERGDLFLYHVFKEGRLLEGDKATWALLKQNFRVGKDFGEEISRNRKFLRWLQRGSKYDGAIVPYLAHLCRALKNLAIFSLAEQRDYIFDKRRALRKAFPTLSDESISLLVNANNSFERNPARALSYPAIDSTNIKRLNREIALAANLPRANAAR